MTRGIDGGSTRWGWVSGASAISIGSVLGGPPIITRNKTIKVPPMTQVAQYTNTK
jgi:hypothetical protein